MRIIRRIFKAVFFLLLLLLGVYFLGPKVDKPHLTMNLPAMESNLAELQNGIYGRERLNTKIKSKGLYGLGFNGL